MSSHPGRTLRPELEAVEQSRLFVREPGWHVTMKHGNDRVFCHAMSPGEEHYHRLGDGEIHLVRSDERLCLPCAARLGLLRTEARRLGAALIAPRLDADDADSGYDIVSPAG
jgi:hypothetical protein